MTMMRAFGVGMAVLSLCGCGKTGNAGSMGAGGEASDPNAPKRATLSVSGLANVGEAVRLADGVLGADDGDVALQLAVQLSLVSPKDESDAIFCRQGTFPTLREVPADQTCPGSANKRWQNKLFLSGATYHDDAQSDVIGSSALVYNAGHDTLYRIRVVGDTAGPNSDGSLGVATATFEYEVIPDGG